MNYILSALIGLFLAGTCFAATPDQEKAFIDAYKTAYEKNDTKTLESFLYTKDADPEALEFYKMMMAAEPGAKISNISLRDLTADEVKKAAEVMEGPMGGSSKLPLKPTKKLILEIKMADANGSSTSKSESFVAELDGKFMIPVPVPAK